MNSSESKAALYDAVFGDPDEVGTLHVDEVLIELGMADIDPRPSFQQIRKLIEEGGQSAPLAPVPAAPPAPAPQVRHHRFSWLRQWIFPLNVGVAAAFLLMVPGARSSPSETDDV